MQRRPLTVVCRLGTTQIWGEVDCLKGLKTTPGITHLSLAVCRDTPANAPGLKELSLDLSLWQPLIEDRAFVPWLIKHPSDQVLISQRPPSKLITLHSLALLGLPSCFS